MSEMAAQNGPMLNNDNRAELDQKWQLSAIEIDTLGEIGNICMGASATALSTLLDRRVSITTPRVSVCSSANQLGAYKKPYVAVEVAYTEGILGQNVFLLKQEDALLITDLLMGGDSSMSSDNDLESLYLSALSEVMNQMVGASATSLANILGIPVLIAPPTVKEILMDEDNLDNILALQDAFIKTSFSMEIEGLLGSEIMQILPYGFGKELVGTLMGEAEAPATTPPAPLASPPAPAPAPPAPAGRQDNNNKVGVTTVQYQDFAQEPAAEPSCSGKVQQPGRDNIDLIMDVPLNVTVELGKSKKSVKEILALKMGSVIVLDRLAGEMVDVLVNGKLFAKGEVVVIDDSYGVRVTEIIDKKGSFGP